MATGVLIVYVNCIAFVMHSHVNTFFTMFVKITDTNNIGNDFCARFLFYLHPESFLTRVCIPSMQFGVFQFFESIEKMNSLDRKRTLL